MSKKIKITYFVLFALITSCIYMSVFSNTSVSKSSTESQNVLEKQEKPRFSSLSTDNGTIYPNVTMGDFVIYSDFVKDNFTMYVSLPADYNISSSQEYPVIYLLDGDWYFSQARFIISKLITDRFMPPAILVGVGYGPLDAEDLRQRDYNSLVENFYNFLQYELVPYIDSTYNTNPLDRTLIGHSAGGHFTLYALFKYRLDDPGIFNNFLAIAPGVFSVGYEIQMNLRISGVLPKKLFLPIGSNDEYEEGFGLITQVKQFVSLFEEREYREFKFDSRIYEGLTHYSVIYPSIEDGLKFLFESSDTPILIDGVDAEKDWDDCYAINSGAGTPSDPYVIENLMMNLSYYFTSGIEIRNSDKYLILRNITVINSKNIYNAGITIVNSTNVNITDCNINDSQIGIELNNTSDIRLSNNSFQKSGVFLSNSFSSTIDSSNIVNSKPVYYFENQKALSIDGLTDVGQLILVNCSNSIVSNVNLSFTSVGLLLSNSANNTFSGLNVWKNVYGVYLEQSNDNKLSNLKVFNNTAEGLALISSDRNKISNSTFYYNLGHGILLMAAYNNEISQNVLHSNELEDLYGNLSDNTISDNEFEDSFDTTFSTNTSTQTTELTNTNSISSSETTSQEVGFQFVIFICILGVMAIFKVYNRRK